MFAYLIRTAGCISPTRHSPQCNQGTILVAGSLQGSAPPIAPTRNQSLDNIFDICFLFIAIYTIVSFWFSEVLRVCPAPLDKCPELLATWLEPLDGCPGRLASCPERLDNWPEPPATCPAPLDCWPMPPDSCPERSANDDFSLTGKGFPDLNYFLNWAFRPISSKPSISSASTRS